MKKIFLGFIIIFLAFFFRFNNLNWDANAHLHPDERFLTMVGTAMKLPTTANQYFDQKSSLMNPTNIGYSFFVYGRFPLTLTKYMATWMHLDNYNDFTILGRQLSAFFDLLTLFFVIKITQLLISKYRGANFNEFQRISTVPYWAGFFYAISVLSIQLSHFFAVDTFLNFFMIGSFYFALRYSIKGEETSPLQRDIIISSIFFGLALSCKVTALFILPLNFVFISLAQLKRPSQLGKSSLKLFLFFFIYLLVSYLTVRLADPYYFQNPSFFDPSISKLFMSNIKSLKDMTVKSMSNWFPPMVQWLNKNSVQHSLVNNIVFGLSIPYSILIIIGMVKIIFNKFSKIKNQLSITNYQLTIILLWVVCFFIYQSIQVTPTLRYFIIIYPFLAIFAGFGIEYLINFKIYVNGKHFIYPKYYSHIFISISVLILLIWPVMFSSIYSNKNSRVAASEWIYKNLPSGSLIIGESWDDSLPIGVAETYGKQFSSDQLPVFDPDTSDKFIKMNNLLSKADYYVISSNRGWGSIMTVPQKYPKMVKFYAQLLSDNNVNYKKIKEFDSFPQLSIGNFQFSINDQWSDEGFTVYDHPQVLIFKNERHSSISF